MGNAICMLAGTPTLAAAAIALIVAKPIVTASISVAGCACAGARQCTR
jgi:hypothetical protein